MSLDDDPSVTEFLNDFKRGDASAFDELWKLYFSRLVAVGGVAYSISGDRAAPMRKTSP